MRKDWGNVLILPIREWEAGYGPAHSRGLEWQEDKLQNLSAQVAGETENDLNSDAIIMIYLQIAVRG